jgi:transketolase
MAARDLLEAEGIGTRVVSVPCFELFAAQPADYQEALIGETPVKVAVEAGVRMGWDHFIGLDGGFVGMTGFGASGTDKALYQHFGITPEAVAAAAKAKL